MCYEASADEWALDDDLLNSNNHSITSFHGLCECDRFYGFKGEGCDQLSTRSALLILVFLIHTLFFTRMLYLCIVISLQLRRAGKFDPLNDMISLVLVGGIQFGSMMVVFGWINLLVFISYGAMVRPLHWGE